MFESQLSPFRGTDNCVRLVGHRGARGIMPENTILGFEWTLRMGVDALEFDVMITRDGVPVIVHDHHLNAATARGEDGVWLSEPGPAISDLTFKELQQFDVGGLNLQSDYGMRFPEQAFLNKLRVPSLDQLLDLVVRPEFSHVRLMLEIKSAPSETNPALEREKVVRAVVNSVRNFSLQSRTVLHSFDWEILQICQAQASDMPSSYLSNVPDQPEDVADHALGLGKFGGQYASAPDAVAQMGGRIWAPHHSDVTRDVVAHAKSLGLIVATWTVNEIDDICRVTKCGVDAIVTDYPARVQRELAKRNMVWRDDPSAHPADLSPAV